MYYFDSSVIVSAILDEDRADEARELLDLDTVRLTSVLTTLETRSAISRLRRSFDRSRARLQLENGLASMHLMYVTEDDWKLAARLVEAVPLRSLDAIHVTAARKFIDDGIRMVTFDRRMADAARALGLEVLGA